MSEYIDRQALLDAIPPTKEDKQISLYGAVADFISLVCDVPAADVAPVVHGHWISEYIGYGVTRYRCSRCGVIIGESEIDDFGHSKYCCMCGAKMDGTPCE